MDNRKFVKTSEVVAQCRLVLCGMTVAGPENARALAAVFDDLGIVEQRVKMMEAKEENGNAATEDPDRIN